MRARGHLLGLGVEHVAPDHDIVPGQINLGLLLDQLGPSHVLVIVLPELRTPVEVVRVHENAGSGEDARRLPVHEDEVLPESLGDLNLLGPLFRDLEEREIGEMAVLEDVVGVALVQASQGLVRALLPAQGVVKEDGGAVFANDGQIRRGSLFEHDALDGAAHERPGPLRPDLVEHPTVGLGRSRSALEDLGRGHLRQVLARELRLDLEADVAHQVNSSRGVGDLRSFFRRVAPFRAPSNAPRTPPPSTSFL